MRSLARWAHLILLLAMLLVLAGSQTARSAPSGTLADRVLIVELRLEEVRGQTKWLLGLVAADLLSTLALWRQGKR